jgi:hypothetical protein
MKSLIMPALCGLSLLLSVPAQADATKNCHIGSYRLSDGQTFDIAPSDGDTLRWRTFTGETGHLQQIAEVIDPSESLDERIGRYGVTVSTLRNLIWSDRVNTAKSVGMFL